MTGEFLEIWVDHADKLQKSLSDLFQGEGGHPPRPDLPHVSHGEMDTENLPSSPTELCACHCVRIKI